MPDCQFFKKNKKVHSNIRQEKFLKNLPNKSKLQKKKYQATFWDLFLSSSFISYNFYLKVYKNEKWATIMKM